VSDFLHLIEHVRANARARTLADLVEVPVRYCTVHEAVESDRESCRYGIYDTSCHPVSLFRYPDPTEET
jgi:hypothetical protein